MENRSIVRNSIILASAGIMVKFLGFLFKVPLTRMIGAEGFGLYSYPYLIYTALLALSTIGIPVVISKLIAEKVALHRYREANRIFKLTLILMTFVGLMSSLVLYFLSDYLAGHIWPRDALIPLKGLLLAPLFVSILSVFRGYFQGMQMMFAYSLSQIIEALGRFVIGLYLANLLLGRGIEYAAAGGTFGATAGSILACIFLLFYYFYKRKEISAYKDEFMADEHKESTRSILAHLLKPLIPVSIAALAVTIMPLIDSLLVKNSLFAAGILEKESTMLFGSLGAATTLINFPLTISYAVSITIIPTISNASARGKKDSRTHIISDALKITFYLMIPAAVGLFILSDQVMHTIFPDIENALWILRFSSLTLVLISVNQIVVATLQGLGLFMKPVKNIFIGAFIKIIVSYSLMRIPEINILGAIIGTFIGYSVTTYRSSRALIKENVLKLRYFTYIIKPIIASLFMSAYLYIVPSIADISLLTTLITAFIIYIAIMDITGAIDIKKIINSIFNCAT